MAPAKDRKVPTAAPGAPGEEKRLYEHREEEADDRAKIAMRLGGRETPRYLAGSRMLKVRWARPRQEMCSKADTVHQQVAKDQR